MNILRSSTRAAMMAACGLAMLGSGPGSAATAGATVTGLEGVVEQRTAAKPVWHASAVKATLLPGESIRTHTGARAELTLADGNVTRIAPTTTVRLGDQAQPGRLRLLLGKLYTRFSKPHAPVTIETPTMTAAISGTEVLVSVNEANVGHVTVFEGKAEVTGNMGDKVEVQKGEWVEVLPNQPVGRPTAFGMQQLRQTEPLLREIGTGLGVTPDDNIWK